jgi:ubiquinone/menaquinone biosynthesis C-methylase UbiE
MLSREQARAFYDRFGSKQDWQGFYEDPATMDLIAHADLPNAGSVFELGCGTGRFAETLLENHLPPSASYLGIDISSTMVDLAHRRLGRFGERVEVRLTEGEPKLDVKGGGFDRFVSTYVLDLLSFEDIRSVVAEAHRILAPGGLVGFASLTHGQTRLAKLVGKAWMGLHSIRPSLVGGCRPISLLDFLPDSEWKIRHAGQVTSFGISSEVIVAEMLLT